jgi:poly-gamma-glutamate capsule biosynthesis protein CapA/YwtB (metallophosphatase superfamily)
MTRLFLALGAGTLVGIALFVPVSRTVSLPFVAPAEAPVRVLFVGDIMLDRNVAATAEVLGVPYLFASTSQLFANADVRVANLEGTVTANQSIARQNNKILHFTFEPTIARQALHFLNLTAVSLANNHSLDFGEFGYDETRENLGAIGVQPFGQPFNDAGKLSTIIKSGGKSLCFVGYHALFNPATNTMVEEIKTLRPDCWRTIVFAHWGVEYQSTSTASQQSAAHVFIDAGADLVVGAHPHVVQEAEVYRGKAIFYSLGNFMFDQNFSWAVTHGLALRVDFSDTETRFILTPTTIIGQKAGIAEGEDRQRVLKVAGVADFTLP